MFRYHWRTCFDIFPVLDALGKPTSGIERGSFYFVGSYDQCYQIEPRISRGDVIGSVKQTQSREFGTRFCRADIAIPDTFIDSLNVVRIIYQFSWFPLYLDMQRVYRCGQPNPKLRVLGFHLHTWDTAHVPYDCTFSRHRIEVQLWVLYMDCFRYFVTSRVISPNG